MASTTRTRSAPARSTRKPARGAQPGFIDRMKAQAALAADALPHIAGSSRLRREVLGFVLVVIAILTAVVLGRGGDDGRLVNWWGGVLADSFGRAAPLVPLLTGLVALRALGSQPGPILEGRHYLGGFLFTVAVVGLLQLGAGLDDPAAGGYLGIAVATLTLRILGQLGSGLVLFVGGVFAVFLLAGSDLQTFWADLRALAAFIAGACATAWAAVVRAAKFAAPARPRGIPVDDTPSPDPLPGRRAAQAAAAPELDAEWSPKPAPGGRKRIAARAGAEPAIAGSEPVAALRSGMTATLDAPADDPDPAFEPRQEPVIVMAAPSRRLPTVEALPEIDPDSADDSLDRLLDAAMEEGTPTPPRPRASRARSNGRAAVVETEVQVEAETEPAEEAIPINRLEPERVAPAAPSRPVVSGRDRVAAPRLPMPEVARLSYYDSVEPDTGSLHAKARVIESTLSSFRVEARVREINPGPAVTQFALEPGTGTKVRRITELQNDLALALAAPSIRIEAPIPGMARVGLEIPNEQIATVGLRETLESSTFVKGKAKLPIPLGRDVNGRYVVGDLTRMPHLLIAGSTGSGKSVCLNCIISTFLLTLQPDELKLVMIDPKMVELTGYNGVPHLQCPVVTEMDKVVGTLRLVLREMERRYTMFANLGVRNLDGYRDKVADEPGAEKLPYLVVIIDELADLMMTAPDDVEGLLVRLAQMARATGIHLIIATQRPSVDVVTGLIKANVPSRVAFAVSSLTDSRVVLDMPGAERLLGRGDMLYLPADAAKPQRIQGAFLEDKDAQYIVNHWHTHAPVPQFAQEWLDVESSAKSSGGGGADPGEWEDDPLFEQALHLVRAQGTASASMLQRRLRVGYNRAARLIERMEDEGYIGPADGVRGRPVLLVDD